MTPNPSNEDGSKAEPDNEPDNAPQSEGSINEQITAIAQEASAVDPSEDNGIIDITDEDSALRNLTSGVRDQDDLERDITYKANLALIDAEDKRDEKRIEKVQATIQKLNAQKKTQEEHFRKAIGKPQ
ncbi:hypothetical protein PC116_g30071, partial [Phytophthora cactorum]